MFTQKWARNLVRVVCVASACLGAVVSLPVLWNSVDIAMAVMTVTNLVAIALLWKWVAGALRDYEAQTRADKDPVFVATDNKFLPDVLKGDVWVRRED